MRESEKEREGERLQGENNIPPPHPPTPPLRSILELNHVNIVMSSALLLTNHRKLNFSAQLTYCQS